MQDLGQQFKRRAKELELSDAEVARRAGLSPRRYGHYVTGQREPDLQTFVRICKVLNTTPDQLLGFEEKLGRKRSRREVLIEKLVATADGLDDEQLRLAVRQMEAMFGQ